MLNYNNYARKDNNIGKYIFQYGFKFGLISTDIKREKALKK